MNNDRDYEGATQPFDAHLARAKAGDAEHNRLHPNCTVCGTLCCIKVLCRICHEAERGVVRSGRAVHGGQCLVIFIKARAVETMASLVNDVTEALRVFRDRDHIPLTDAQIAERANNIACSVAINYDVQRIEREPVDFADARIR